MTPSEHFMRHAAECRSMAEIAIDADSKATWIGMAERWRRCAELAKQNLMDPPLTRHRKPASH